ncbi:hypothetical protein M3Y98_00918200 [Aphelenchoides besseyi]|nr:hypothetical protein M3Y98_00918200 [Aphelenchoides besseyi]
MVNWTLPIGSDNLADFFATLSVGVDVPFQWIQQMQRRVLDLMFVFNGFKIVDEVCDNHRKQRLLITEQVLIDSNSANSPVKFIMAIREKHVPGVTNEDLSDNTLRNVKDIPSIQSDVPSIGEGNPDDPSDLLAQQKKRGSRK